MVSSTHQFGRIVQSDNSAVSASISAVYVDRWPDRYGGVKAMARALGCSVRAAYAYRKAQRDMRAATLIRAMAADDELAARVLALIQAQREEMQHEAYGRRRSEVATAGGPRGGVLACRDGGALAGDDRAASGRVTG